MFEHTRASIGVGVFVRKGEEILVGRRGPACSRGAGMFALPGGHLDHPETFHACVRREVEEETGVLVDVAVDARDAPYCIRGLLAVTDHFDQTQQLDGLLTDHLTFWMMSRHTSGDPVVMEPTKCLGWEWVRPATLLRQLGQACENPTDPQFHWVPAPLWRKILRPWFGEM